MNNNGMIFPPSYYDPHWDDDREPVEAAPSYRCVNHPERVGVSSSHYCRECSDKRRAEVNRMAMARLSPEAIPHPCPECGQRPVWAKDAVCLVCYMEANR